MIYIGIDNGLTGALVALSDYPGPPIAMRVMPTITRRFRFDKTRVTTRKGIKAKITAPATSNEIDGASVTSWIREVTDSRPCVILIEECPEHAKQKSTMRSMAISYGILVGAITAGLPGYRLEIARSGNPHDSWQRMLLGKLSHGDTKPAALARCRQLWPSESWLATPRSTKPHEGLIDAALIAEYGRISNL